MREDFDSARMILSGLGCRLQTCSCLATEWFNSTFRAAVLLFSLKLLLECTFWEDAPIRGKNHLLDVRNVRIALDLLPHLPIHFTCLLIYLITHAFINQILIHSFIYTFNKYLLSSFLVLSPALDGAGDTVVMTIPGPGLTELTVQQQRQ